MAQGDESNAKDDTRFLSRDPATGGTGLEVDLSHQADNLSVGTSSVYEASGARWDFTTLPWAVDVALVMNDTSAGYLYSRETGGLGIRLQATAGDIEALVDGVVVATVTPVDAANEDEQVITWSMEANPLTTGASDAARSELRCYNRSSGGYVQHVVTHAMPSAAAATAIWGARTTAGADAFDGQLLELRWSVGRFHPASETREDFVALTAPPTLVFESRREVPVPTRDSDVGAHGQFAGPVYQAVAAALHQTDLRQAGAIVAELYRSPATLDNSPLTVRRLDDPDGDGFILHGSFLVHRPVPRPANRLQVRVHVQAWRVDAELPSPITIRCYSMARTPLGLAGNAGPLPAWTRFYQEVEVEANDGSGTTGGAWYTFDPLRIARDGTGDGTYLALAWSVGGDAELADNQRFRIRAWTVEPGIVDTAGDLPLGGIG